jgi:hypothetical protein
MSTGAIVAIVVAVVVIAIVVLAVLPRLRARKNERALERRRGGEAERLRESAADRNAQAELAEREAERARAEAAEQEARADLHERGLADDELGDRRREHANQ